jgi:putative component of membrane protein insertase Oxa1/YidC/SpoIIIJ protein YidD
MKIVLIPLIRLYQWLEAPRRLYPLCGCKPCCSKFAILCLQRFSFLVAMRLIVRRLKRCGTAAHHIPYESIAHLVKDPS